MNQRRLLVLAVGAALCGHAALPRAQTPATGLRRVGVLAPSTQAKEEITLKPFFDQMRELGWIEGRNIAYDRVYADDQQQTLGQLAAELVARQPELIYAPPAPAAVAARGATRTIPIVFAAVFDPIDLGLVTSLARPGGNATGTTTDAAWLLPKWLELLKEVMPGAKRIGRLRDPGSVSGKLAQQALASLPASPGLTFVIAEATNPAEFDAAVSRLVAQRVDVIMAGGTLVSNMRGRLIELANRQRLPVIAGGAQFADAGALFTYGASLADALRRSAAVVDKVLKGTRPADIPVEQPSMFELVVNLKTARALGIAVPQSVLLRADRVIE